MLVESESEIDKNKNSEKERIEESAILEEDENKLLCGNYTITCQIPADLLNNRSYTLNVRFGMPSVKVLIKGKDYLLIMLRVMKPHASFVVFMDLA